MWAEIRNVNKLRVGVVNWKLIYVVPKFRERVSEAAAMHLIAIKRSVFLGRILQVPRATGRFDLAAFFLLLSASFLCRQQATHASLRPRAALWCILCGVRAWCECMHSKRVEHCRARRGFLSSRRARAKSFPLMQIKGFSRIRIIFIARRECFQFTPFASFCFNTRALHNWIIAPSYICAPDFFHLCSLSARTAFRSSRTVLTRKQCLFVDYIVRNWNGKSFDLALCFIYTFFKFLYITKFTVRVRSKLYKLSALLHFAKNTIWINNLQHFTLH